MSGKIREPQAAPGVEQLVSRLACEYQRIETHAVPAQFASNVMRSIRVEMLVESPFSAVALRFALLTSACSAVFVVMNLGLFEVFNQARFIGVLGVYGYVL